jgi:Domain of unknown function (DUF1906)
MTMLEGVDYSSSRPGGAALAAAGKRFCVRYVPYGGYSKGLDRAELADLRAHGIAVALVWEQVTSRALQGSAAGAADALTSQAAVVSLGFPAGTPIYFAVDFDATLAQQPAINQYLNGAASVIGKARVGVYGSYNVLCRCRSNGTAAWFWQTYAWSGGQIASYAHLYQYHNGVALNGSVDLCRAMQTNYGQWNAPGMTPPETSTTAGDPPMRSFTTKPIGSARFDAVPNHACVTLDGSPWDSGWPAGTNWTIYGEITLTPPLPGGLAGADRASALLVMPDTKHDGTPWVAAKPACILRMDTDWPAGKTAVAIAAVKLPVTVTVTTAFDGVSVNSFSKAV